MAIRTFTVVVCLLGLLTGISAPGVAGEHVESPEGLVVGGGPVTAPPWVAAIVDASVADPVAGLVCGGSLVDAEWVLTAGHCIDGLDVRDIEVVVGSDALRDGTRLAVGEAVVHPDYGDDRARGDLALLRLASPTTQEPLEIATAPDTLLAVPGAPAMLYGWGATDPAGATFPGDLHLAVVTVSADADCSESAYVDPQAAVRMCAGGEGVGACTGDSGGPLAVWSDGRAVQVGVVSAGIDPCGSAGFDEYVEVAAYAPWIAAVTGGADAGLVGRIGGSAEEVAVALSRLGYAPGQRIAFVATSSTFPDGLAGGALAAGAGPLLLTPTSSVPRGVLAELRRLRPDVIVAIGGEAAISAQAERQLEGVADTVRLAGTDRYATAARVADAWGDTVSRVYVATGENYPDALAAVPTAFGDGPVVLTRRDRLPGVTADLIRSVAPREIVIIGGPAAVGATVEEELSVLGPTRRVAGADRYATAALLATDETASPAPPYVFVTTGRDFPDALVAGVAAARVTSPLLLADGPLTADAVNALRTLGPDRAVAVGPDERLPHEVVDDLNLHLTAGSTAR